MAIQSITKPVGFDVCLSALPLEAGGEISPLWLRGTRLGPPGDLPVLESRVRLLAEGEPLGMERGVVREFGRTGRERTHPSPGAAAFDTAVPTVLVIHALTGDARAGGPGGWWEPLIGPGRALDPAVLRLLCFNNLGSCYGSSGPGAAGYPTRADQGPAFERGESGGGDWEIAPASLPATVTTWDQARALLEALDALGIDRVALATGGSLGGMIALCLGALAPERFERLCPIAATDAAGAWLIAFNHVARQILLLDPRFPEGEGRGLELARQLALLSYRAEPGLQERQGRRQVGVSPAGFDAGFEASAPYRVQTYLEHQGRKLVQRFDSRAYLTQLGAMDHHDLSRFPGGGDGLARLRAAALVVSIDSDLLYWPSHSARLAARLRSRGLPVEEGQIASPHGHDAFLIEWAQLDALLRRALALPSGIA